MKKIIFFLPLVIFFANAGFSQPNNPSNKNGIQCVASIKLISDDYKAGRIKDFDQPTIDYYSKKIPLQTEVKASVDMVSTIVNGLKSPGFDIKSYISNSSLPEFSKKTMLEILNIQNSASGYDVLKKLSSEVEIISQTKISDSEKQNMLSYLSVIYNLNQSDLNNTKLLNSFYGNRKEEAGVGATFGFIIGGFFGPGGALIGAVVGGVIAGLT